MNSVKEIWHPHDKAHGQLLQAAAHICGHGDTPQYRAIAHFLTKRDTELHHKPVKVGGTDTIFAAYHNGSHYDIYAAGEPEQILQHCQMSDNDREKSLLESRRLMNGGAQIITIATATVATLPNSLGSLHSMALCGHISVI